MNESKSSDILNEVIDNQTKRAWRTPTMELILMGGAMAGAGMGGEGKPNTAGSEVANTSCNGGPS